MENFPDLKLFSLILAEKSVFPDCKKFSKFSLIGGNPDITTISQFYGAFTLPETETKTYKIGTDPNGNVFWCQSLFIGLGVGQYEHAIKTKKY